MSFTDFEMESITGDTVNFSRYQGQVSLIVNLASNWGLTPQYAGLRALQEDHGANGFNVLGFPCNQLNFPMFAKSDVNGETASPLYQWLRAEQPGDGDSSDIAWNFEKFLVDRSGDVVARWSPTVTPEEIGEQLSAWL